MGVLWWLAPPLGATVLAMLWAGWRGRARDDRLRPQDADAELARLGSALSRPLPSRARRTAPAPADPTHGIAVRRTPRTASETAGRR